MAEIYSKLEMIDAVRAHLVDDGFELGEVYDPAFEPARVPIFGTKSLNGAEIEIFVDIITEREIKVESYFSERNFKSSLASGLVIKDACSAQFYRHYFPNACIYWAIPGYIVKDEDYEKFLEKCVNGGIGIFIVNMENKNGETKVEKVGEIPKTLLEERVGNYSEIISKSLGVVLNAEQLGKIREEFGKFNHQNLSYLAFYPQPMYQARDVSTREPDQNISKELINKMVEIENLSYKGILKELSEKYNSESKNDYQIALHYSELLWKKYGMKFPNLHKDFENILKLDPGYRDHFIHSFQVFLFGSYIIDKMYPAFASAGFGRNLGARIEDAWMLAATYHDYTYMIQNFKEWTREFFESALHYEGVNPASLHLEESYIKEGFMFKTKELLRFMRIKADKETLDFLFDRILVRKNHGFLSALSLLKYIDKQSKNKLTKKVRFAAAKAIALHDRGIWELISGIAEDHEIDKYSVKIGYGEDKIGKAFNKKKVIEKINIFEDPVTFILNLADCVQEEGRDGLRAYECKAHLEKMNFEEGIIRSEVSFNGPKTEETFHKKHEELVRVKKFLEGEGKFVVTIINGNDGTKIELPFNEGVLTRK